MDGLIIGLIVQHREQIESTLSFNNLNSERLAVIPLTSGSFWLKSMKITSASENDEKGIRPDHNSFGK